MFRVGDLVRPNGPGMARLRQAAEEWPTTMGAEIEHALDSLPWTISRIEEDEFDANRLNSYMFEESVYIGCFEFELEATE